MAIFAFSPQTNPFLLRDTSRDIGPVSQQSIPKVVDFDSSDFSNVLCSLFKFLNKMQERRLSLCFTEESSTCSDWRRSQQFQFYQSRASPREHWHSTWWIQSLQWRCCGHPCPVQMKSSMTLILQEHQAGARWSCPWQSVSCSQRLDIFETVLCWLWFENLFLFQPRHWE